MKRLMAAAARLALLTGVTILAACSAPTAPHIRAPQAPSHITADSTCRSSGYIVYAGFKPC